MSDWKYIDEYTSLPNADFIYCDTRDFYILCIESKEHIKETLKEIYREAGHGTLSDCKFTKEEILPVLKDLETRSGGKGSWRYITSEKYDWLKYIRFVKCNNKYIAYTTNYGKYYVLSHNDLSAPVNKEYLNHMQYGKKYQL